MSDKLSTDNSLDLQDFLDATSDASKRTRVTLVILVVGCVLGMVGFLNSIQSSWMLQRLKIVGDPSSSYIKDKLGFEPSKNYELYEGFHHAIARSYVENALVVKVPFFGAAFDINDLSLLSGIGFVIVLLMLRSS